MLLLALALVAVPSRQSERTRLCRLIPSAAGSQAVDARSSTGWLPMLCGAAFGLLAATVVGGWTGLALAPLVAAGAGLLCGHVIRRGGATPVDVMPLAAGWDLLAACLRAGLPVPLAVRAVAGHLPGAVGVELRTVAERLALGADPQSAWDVPETSPLHKLARAARRSAHSGSGLAELAVRAASEVRADVRSAAAARGQRAAVLITGPLGLCFLPAFLVLGVAPVVIGLASGLASIW
jgi:Flp pilus assembly protein TadB